MATLPIKLLHDENNRPFIPFTIRDTIYQNYPDVESLPQTEREGVVVTVTNEQGEYNLYIYHNGEWHPLTQEGPPGQSGVYVGPTEPTEEQIVIWIDTTGNPGDNPGSF